MRQELDDKLCQMFPSVFRDRDNHKTCFGQRGFECGDGWFGLIAQLAAALSEMGCDIRVQQIKEKFGKLRTYASGTDVSWKICQEFEDLSGNVCEECSASPAFISAVGGYYRTRCHECYTALRKEQGPHVFDFCRKEDVGPALMSHRQRVIEVFIDNFGMDAVRAKWAEMEPSQTAETVRQVRGVLGTIEAKIEAKKAAD